MTDSTQTPFKPYWKEDEEGNLEFVPFELTSGEGATIPLDFSDEELLNMGVDISTEEGRNTLAQLLRDSLNVLLEGEIEPRDVEIISNDGESELEKILKTVDFSIPDDIRDFADSPPVGREWPNEEE